MVMAMSAFVSFPLSLSICNMHRVCILMEEWEPLMEWLAFSLSFSSMYIHYTSPSPLLLPVCGIQLCLTGAFHSLLPLYSLYLPRAYLPIVFVCFKNDSALSKIRRVWCLCLSRVHVDVSTPTNTIHSYM